MPSLMKRPPSRAATSTRQALPTRTLLNLAREITEGEAVLREDPKGRDQLRSLLGLPTASITQTRSGTGQATRDGTSRPRRTRRVARKPTRDLVADRKSTRLNS